MENISHTDTGSLMKPRCRQAAIIKKVQQGFFRTYFFRSMRLNIVAILYGFRHPRATSEVGAKKE